MTVSILKRLVNFYNTHTGIRGAKRAWRSKNSHNGTYLANNFDQNRVFVGRYTYGPLFVLYSSHYDSKLKIGNFCSIAGGVHFLLAIDHYTDHISTFPFKVKVLGKDAEAYSKGDIVVDDDVWIGENAMILSGVHIGQGAIIAAGAVVSKDVPPYTIVGGIPAKVLKHRFAPAVVEKLMKIDYSALSEDNIREHISQLYERVDENTDLDWLPKIN